jgi:hypothetical protein
MKTHAELLEKEVIHKGTPSEIGNERQYENLLEKRHEVFLKRVEEGYKEWKKSKTYAIPKWLYGAPKGKLFKVACDDIPNFGDTSYLEFEPLGYLGNSEPFSPRSPESFLVSPSRNSKPIFTNTLVIL